jgi:hypothetical protein
MTKELAKAYDNRIDRKASLLDTTRPFVAIKPKGYINPVIGHYTSMDSARRAAKRFNDQVANRYA